MKDESEISRIKLNVPAKSILVMGNKKVMIKEENTIQIGKIEKPLPDYDEYTGGSFGNLFIDSVNNLYLILDGRVYLFNDSHEPYLSFKIKRGAQLCVDRNVFFILSEDQRLHRVTLMPEILAHKPSDNKFISFKV